MKVLWLRLFFVFSVCVFFISTIAYVRLNRSISTQSTKDVITNESKHLDTPKTRVRYIPPAKKTRAQYNNTDTDAGESEWATDLNGGPEAGQSTTGSSPTKNSTESDYDVSEEQTTLPTEREVRIAEIKQRLEWISEQRKLLWEEESTLPPRYPPAQEPTRQTREEMERDREIDTRRRELRLRDVELAQEEWDLSRELKALQKEH